MFRSRPRSLQKGPSQINPHTLVARLVRNSASQRHPCHELLQEANVEGSSQLTFKLQTPGEIHLQSPLQIKNLNTTQKTELLSCPRHSRFRFQPQSFPAPQMRNHTHSIT